MLAPEETLQRRRASGKPQDSPCGMGKNGKTLAECSEDFDVIAVVAKEVCRPEDYEWEEKASEAEDWRRVRQQRATTNTKGSSRDACCWSCAATPRESHGTRTSWIAQRHHGNRRPPLCLCYTDEKTKASRCAQVTHSRTSAPSQALSEHRSEINWNMDHVEVCVPLATLSEEDAHSSSPRGHRGRLCARFRKSHRRTAS